MKKINKKKLYLSISMGLLVIFISFFGVTKMTEERLSKTQIEELRDQYPVCGLIVPQGLYMEKESLEDVKGYSDSFVYGEVVGEISTYYVNASTGNIELDEKRKENGINDAFEFYGYPICVIDDTEGEYTKGDRINIVANSVFKDYNPKLTNGMKIVCSVIKDKMNEGKNYFTVTGMYYVTDDGYAISAFEETSTFSRRSYSGIKVEDLLNELKK